MSGMALTWRTWWVFRVTGTHKICCDVLADFMSMVASDKIKHLDLGEVIDLIVFEGTEADYAVFSFHAGDFLFIVSKCCDVLLEAIYNRMSWFSFFL